jgi:hypothetical protein
MFIHFLSTCVIIYLPVHLYFLVFLSSVQSIHGDSVGDAMKGCGI